MHSIVFAAGQTPYSMTEPQLLPRDGFIWLDFDRERQPDWPDTLKRWIQTPEIHERHVNDSRNIEHPPFFDGMHNYDMLIVRDLCAAELETGMKTCPLVIFLGRSVLVTVRPRVSPALDDVRAAIMAQTIRTPVNPQQLLHIILDTVVNRFLNLTAPLAEFFERLRTALLKGEIGGADWDAFMQKRRSLRRFATVCEQQADTLRLWRLESFIKPDRHLAVRFNDLAEHLARVLHAVRDMQSEIDFLIQLRFSVIAQRNNNMMGILTVFSAVFLPLNLMAGIFGMNFETMPLLNRPDGFYWLTGGMASLALALLLLFKWKKWI